MRSNVPPPPHADVSNRDPSQDALLDIGDEPGDDRVFPLIVRPARTPRDPIEWFEHRREPVERALRRSGAILFKNLGITTVEVFQRAVAALVCEIIPYREQTSPRTPVADRIYTSTDYPRDQEIFPHNESSYALTFPSTIAFWCHTAAAHGGETPLSDTRKVYRRIDPHVREKFERFGWKYIRNFDDSMGLSWQKVFQTERPSDVDAYCEGAGIRCTWRPGHRLRTTQVRPVALRHPWTGEMSWFNHAMFFHITTLSPPVQAVLRREYREDELPNNTYFGDGSPIDAQTAEHLRDAYRQEMVSRPWQQGDVMIVDNIATAHARRPFAGARRILVALADPYTRTDVE